MKKNYLWAAVAVLIACAVVLLLACKENLRGSVWQNGNEFYIVQHAGSGKLYLVGGTPGSATFHRVMSLKNDADTVASFEKVNKEKVLVFRLQSKRVTEVFRRLNTRVSKEDLERESPLDNPAVSDAILQEMNDVAVRNAQRALAGSYKNIFRPYDTLCITLNGTIDADTTHISYTPLVDSPDASYLVQLEGYDTPFELTPRVSQLVAFSTVRDSTDTTWVRDQFVRRIRKLPDAEGRRWAWTSQEILTYGLISHYDFQTLNHIRMELLKSSERTPVEELNISLVGTVITDTPRRR